MMLNLNWALSSNSLDKLKDYLSHSDTIGYFRLDATCTQLVTAASNVGFGEVLLQEYQGETKVCH